MWMLPKDISLLEMSIFFINLPLGIGKEVYWADSGLESAVWSLSRNVIGISSVHVWAGINQIYIVMLRPTQLTQASFLQKNQMLQNIFLIFLMLR